MVSRKFLETPPVPTGGVAFLVTVQRYIEKALGKRNAARKVGL